MIIRRTSQLTGFSERKERKGVDVWRMVAFLVGGCLMAEFQWRGRCREYTEITVELRNVSSAIFLVGMSNNHEDAAVHKKSKRQKDLVVLDEAPPARERKRSKKSEVQLEDTSAGLAEAIHQEQLKGAEEGERKEKKEKKKRKDKAEAEAEGRETPEKANHDVPTVDLSTKDESLISVKKSKKKIHASVEATEELAPSSSSTGGKRKRKEVAKESDRATETETPKKKNKSTDKAPESTTPAKIEGVEAKTAKRPKRSKKEIEASALDEQREKG